MNVYLQDAGLIKNSRYMRKLRPMLPEKERVFLHLNTEKRITLIEQILLVFFSPNIRKVYLSIPASKVMPHLKWFAFRKDYFKLQTISEIPDDEKWIEEIYYSAVQMPSQNCHYTACLGRTLYIDKKGNISFCPEHPKETMIGNLKTKRAENARRLFDDPVFVEALAKMVEKANTCKKTCPWFRNCKGGCLFETDCENKKTAYQAAAEDIRKMIQEKTDLSTVPKYKEQSVIYVLFSRKK